MEQPQYARNNLPLSRYVIFFPSEHWPNSGIAPVEKNLWEKFMFHNEVHNNTRGQTVGLKREELSIVLIQNRLPTVAI